MSTNRFALTTGDQLTDGDKALVDSVLAAYELHDHQGGVRLSDPSGPPVGVLDTTTGALAAGTTFFYRVSYVDQYGLETAGSPEVSFTTPSGLTPPASPDAVTSPGGLLAKGTTYYAISSVDAVGNETVLSDPRLVALVNDATVTLTVVPFPTSVTSYNVWRQGARSTGFTKIGAITDANVPFVDTGSVPDDPCACDPQNLPPVANQTNATSKVTLTVPDVALLATSVLAWRVYRATSSGAYASNSLVQEITSRVNPDGTGSLITTYADDGVAPLLTGAPLGTSRTLKPTTLITSGGGGGGFVQNPILTTADGTQVRRLDVEHGALVTYAPADRTYGSYGTPYPIGSGPCFRGSGFVSRLTLDNLGGLRLATAVVDEVRDKVYDTGSGFRIVATGGLQYDLTMNAGGALVLTDAT